MVVVRGQGAMLPASRVPCNFAFAALLAVILPKPPTAEKFSNRGNERWKLLSAVLSRLRRIFTGTGADRRLIGILTGCSQQFQDTHLDHTPSLDSSLNRIYFSSRARWMILHLREDALAPTRPLPRDKTCRVDEYELPADHWALVPKNVGIPTIRTTPRTAHWGMGFKFY